MGPCPIGHVWKCWDTKRTGGTVGAQCIVVVLVGPVWVVDRSGDVLAANEGTSSHSLGFGLGLRSVLGLALGLDLELVPSGCGPVVGGRGCHGDIELNTTLCSPLGNALRCSHTLNEDWGQLWSGGAVLYMWGQVLYMLRTGRYVCAN